MTNTTPTLTQSRINRRCKAAKSTTMNSGCPGHCQCKRGLVTVELRVPVGSESKAALSGLPVLHCLAWYGQSATDSGSESAAPTRTAARPPHAGMRGSSPQTDCHWQVALPRPAKAVGQSFPAASPVTAVTETLGPLFGSPFIGNGRATPGDCIRVSGQAHHRAPGRSWCQRCIGRRSLAVQHPPLPRERWPAGIAKRATEAGA